MASIPKLLHTGASASTTLSWPALSWVWKQQPIQMPNVSLCMAHWGINTPGRYFSVAMGREHLMFPQKGRKDIIFSFLFPDSLFVGGFPWEQLLVSWRQDVGTRRGVTVLLLLWCSSWVPLHQVLVWRLTWSSKLKEPCHSELRCPLKMQRCWLHSEMKSWEQIGNRLGWWMREYSFV